MSGKCALARTVAILATALIMSPASFAQITFSYSSFEGFIYSNGTFQSVFYEYRGRNRRHLSRERRQSCASGFICQNGTSEIVDIPNAADNIVWGVNVNGGLAGT